MAVCDEHEPQLGWRSTVVLSVTHRLIRFARIAAAATVVTVCMTGSAHSATRAKPPAYGPMLSGSRAVWAERRRDGGFDVQVATAGGSASLLLSFHPPPGGALIPELAASPSRVVVASGVGEAGPRGASWGARDVYTAAIGASAEQLGSRCDIFGTPDLPRAVDVSGNALVYPRCDGDGQYVHVRDYSTAAPVDEQVPGAQPGGGLRIAGRYVAWLDNGGDEVANVTGITVYDRLAGRISYHIKKGSVGQGVHELDLQTDGKLTFSYQTSDGQRIAWASPAEPRRHTLPLRNANPYDVRIAGDRIAFQVGPTVFAGAVFPATIGITDLEGHARTLAKRAEGGLFSEDFDFDGTRLAWWSYGCSHALIHQVAASAPPSFTPPRSGCPLRFTSSPRLESGGHRLRLFVNCFGFDGGCGLRDTLITAKRDGKRIVVGSQGRGARVQLTSKGRDLIARPGSLRVRVATTLVDLAGRDERRHAHARIGDDASRSGAPS